MSPSKKELDQEEAVMGADAPVTDPLMPEEKSEGTVKISEEVIGQIATQALLKVNGVQPASPGLVANLRLGKKTSGGVRISVEEGETPSVVVDAFITTRYGLRIPDVAWDIRCAAAAIFQSQVLGPQNTEVIPARRTCRHTARLWAP